MLGLFENKNPRYITGKVILITREVKLKKCLMGLDLNMLTGFTGKRCENST